MTPKSLNCLKWLFPQNHTEIDAEHVVNRGMYEHQKFNYHVLMKTQMMSYVSEGAFNDNPIELVVVRVGV